MAPLEELEIDECYTWMTVAFIQTILIHASATLQSVSINRPGWDLKNVTDDIPFKFTKLHTLNVEGHEISFDFLSQLPSLTSLNINDGCITMPTLNSICLGDFGALLLYTASDLRATLLTWLVNAEFTLTKFLWRDLRILDPNVPKPEYKYIKPRRSDPPAHARSGILPFLTVLRSRAQPWTELDLSVHSDMAAVFAFPPPF